MAQDLFDAKGKRERRTWHGAAFSLEALILLLFLVISVMVLMQLFGAAYQQGQGAAELTPAITLASNDAEEFSANPTASASPKYFDYENGSLAPTQESEDAYLVARTVTAEKTESGTLYRAVIEVTYQGSTVYSLSTARYVSEQG